MENAVQMDSMQKSTATQLMPDQEHTKIPIVKDVLEDTVLLESSQSSHATPVMDDQGAFYPDTVASVQLPSVLRHHVFKDGDWKLKLTQSHPTIKLTAFTRKLDYDHFGLKFPPMQTHDIVAITDSGAQCCLWGWNDCVKAGLNRNDLVPVKQRLNDVSKSSIKIYGAVLLRMYGISPSGERITCAAMVFVQMYQGFICQKKR
jgi:hypothetical protein